MRSVLLASLMLIATPALADPPIINLLPGQQYQIIHNVNFDDTLPASTQVAINAGALASINNVVVGPPDIFNVLDTVIRAAATVNSVSHTSSIPVLSTTHQTAINSAAIATVTGAISSGFGNIITATATINNSVNVIATPGHQFTRTSGF